MECSDAGLPELAPAWVAAHREALTLLDVRSAEEVAGPDGRVSRSLWIPLQELEARMEEFPTQQPLVVACHSGSRSALAAQLATRAQARLLGPSCRFHPERPRRSKAHHMWCGERPQPCTRPKRPLSSHQRGN